MIVRRQRKTNRQRGFTLIEVQVATLLFVLAVLTMTNHTRIYGDMVAWLETDNRVSGSVDVDGQRAVLAVIEAGKDPQLPPCRIRLVSAESTSNGSEALVELSDRGG